MRTTLRNLTEIGDDLCSLKCTILALQCTFVALHCPPLHCNAQTWRLDGRDYYSEKCLPLDGPRFRGYSEPSTAADRRCRALRFCCR